LEICENNVLFGLTKLLTLLWGNLHSQKMSFKAIFPNLSQLWLLVTIITAVAPWTI